MEKEEAIKRFEVFQKEIRQKYPDVNVALCELLGRRWSFLCGFSMELSPFVKRVKINERYGISIFDDSMDENRSEEIIKILKGYFDGDK
ncbi:hypothetical protein [Desulfurobacterium indicum]|uniref:Uncharacterized protein n=1 Tax=Desulfurobacterium indicum TaxID=1914305 RepID=A0A1R1MMG4_9BACT|nr:hypothetical protein [Desulfurobacterium indicum]OMH40967.1 hypothetical protein BLW93_02695 [Desulfurobacterium indicum]